MVRILLIKPFVSLHVNQNIELPLGLMALSTYLKREMGDAVSVSLIDLRVEKEREAALRAAIERDRPDIIGLSLMTFERPFLQRHLATIRAAVPHALVVAGGAYPTSDAEGILKEFPALNLVVRGEGEETFTDIVRRHAAGGDLHDIPGTAFLRDGVAVIATGRPFIDPLDRLPRPDYDLIDIERYLGPHTPMNVISAHPRHIAFMTSRGCPYRCSFCHAIMGKGFRPHGAERVLVDMRRLYERFGIREFHIVDDVFNLDRDRMHRILLGVKDIGADIRIAFPNGIRGDLLDEKDIDLMLSAGVYNLTFSVETAAPRLQEMVEKHLDIERTMRMVRYAHRRGIVTKAYFMFGFPGETRDELAATFALSRDPAFDMISYFKVAPFPHTRLAQTCDDLWGEDTDTGPIDYFTGRSRYERETGVPLSRMIFGAYLRFYLPWRIVRLLFRLPRPFLFLSRLIQYAAFVLHIRRSNSPAPR